MIGSIVFSGTIIKFVNYFANKHICHTFASDTIVSFIKFNFFHIMRVLKAGIDVGSTTAKIVITDGDQVVFKGYRRHNAQQIATVRSFLVEAREQLGNINMHITVTGSVGMGISEILGAPFVQEVVAATHCVKQYYPATRTLIDIGGEDAKIVFFDNHRNDLRMNGNCAGGTGAFLDQMAVLLNVNIDTLSQLAAQATQTHHIAARCGVFSKTDIQNLISRNVPKSEIAASIFHAVAVQTITSLARGHKIETPILFCGGPLSLLPALRNAFAQYLQLSPSHFTLPNDGYLIPAMGCAMSNSNSDSASIDIWLNRLNNKPITQVSQRLAPLFSSQQEYKEWQESKKQYQIEHLPLQQGSQNAVLGIDSGSTTTKIVVTDTEGRILFTHYCHNNGNPIEAVNNGLKILYSECEKQCCDLRIVGSCSTGYGEELIKTALNLDHSIIETMAHYHAAQHLMPDVSFIIDIGGQDMKAIFTGKGAITRMELNEACSSGCGSFIESFANTLGYSASQFAHLACTALSPCDLGTRCTVFMNSKVKQVIREGATVADIAAGLSYSVIKNCLHKVLKIKEKKELGNKIVVQGGTMCNDAIVRAFEVLTDTTVARSNIPALMGAYGCALAALKHRSNPRTVSELYQKSDYTQKSIQCHGCENRCNVYSYTFDNGNSYYSGNKCENIFGNHKDSQSKGQNIYTHKNALLFSRKSAGKEQHNSPVIGIARALNMYEEYPFWHTLFTSCGIATVLSDASTYKQYERSLNSVMSDNICFPAKLTHSHIQCLIDKGADRIFMPYVVYEKRDDKHVTNSYNCPIVSGYSDVIRNAMTPGIPIDSPPITFANHEALTRQCIEYLHTLGISRSKALNAVKAALQEQERYEQDIKNRAIEILEKSRQERRITILLAGRPYHSDILVQHKVSEMIASLGVNVISDDIVRHDNTTPTHQSYLVQQWSYINRILKAASWCAQQGNDVHFVQITSFGCGPDAFLLDEVRDILLRHDKPFTLLKVDDINNQGSLKLRIRSLIESLKNKHQEYRNIQPFVKTPIFGKSDKHKKIIAPFFSDYISPLLPPFFALAGYDVEILPLDNIESANIGLQYANNEVCYPATLVTGSLIKALQSGRYDLNNTAVAITQTGGQCRATNYVALVKRALISAGFTTVPVITLGVYGSTFNEQEGFNIPWGKLLPLALSTILYTDTLSRLYHSAAPRENIQGVAVKLRDTYISAAYKPIRNNKPAELLHLIEKATTDFAKITTPRNCHRVGIVGEVYLKFNSFAHQNIVNEFIKQGIEPVSPTLLSLLTTSLVNTENNIKFKTKQSPFPTFAIRAAYKFISREIEKYNRVAQKYPYYKPLENIYDTARRAQRIVSLAAQFGEGWLLPGETASMAEEGINHVISLQPFGCIANHIISKGIEKRLHTLYPQLNFLSLDFDSGVSNVNVINRIRLFTDSIARSDRKISTTTPCISKKRNE